MNAASQITASHTTAISQGLHSHGAAKLIFFKCWKKKKTLVQENATQTNIVQESATQTTDVDVLEYVLEQYRNTVLL